MKRFRALPALLAMPVALSLAACGGGGTTVSNVVGTQGQIRFINGAPGAGAFDVYYTSTGTVATSTPLVSNLQYGQITDFSAQSTTSVTVTLRPGNSGSSAVSNGGCSVPQLANNTNFSVVFVNPATAGAGINCVVFQDANYSASGQFRVHHAAPTAPATVSYGLTNGTSSPTFTVAGTASFPGIGNTAFAPVPVSGPATAGSPVGFAVGAAAQPGTVQPTLAQINANQLVSPGGVAGSPGPDTANTLPGLSGQNNASIFAIDAPGGGVRLIGSLDSR